MKRGPNKRRWGRRISRFGYAVALGSRSLRQAASLGCACLFLLLSSAAATTGDGPQATAVPARLLYSTFIGGNGSDSLSEVVVDHGGNMTLMGWTSSPDFLDGFGVNTSNLSNGASAFVMKLDPGGAVLFVVSLPTCLAADIALDREGAAVVVGNTGGGLENTTDRYQSAYAGGASDICVVKLDKETGAVAWSTYLGGGGNWTTEEYGNSIALGPGGEVYVAGYVETPDFPVTPGAFDTRLDAMGNGFVAKISGDGKGLIYSTFLNGSEIRALAVGTDGGAYVTGRGYGIPLTAGAFQANFTEGGFGSEHAFVTRFSPDGSGLAYSTYLRGWSSDVGEDIDVGYRGEAYVTGVSYSADFPLTADAFDKENVVGEAFLSVLSPSGDRLEFSSFLGGGRSKTIDPLDGWDVGYALERDAAGNVLLVGSTSSPSFPLSNETYDATYSGRPCDMCLDGDSDGFVAQVTAGSRALAFSSYLGEMGNNWVRGAAFAPGGEAVLVGTTNSPAFPVTPDAWDTSFGGKDSEWLAGDGFLVRMNVTGPEMARVTLTTEPEGLDLLIDGVSVEAPVTISWEAGSDHLVGAPSPQEGAETSYVFANWSDGQPQAHAVRADRSFTLTARFNTVVGPAFLVEVEPLGVRVATGASSEFEVRVRGLNHYSGPPAVITFEDHAGGLNITCEPLQVAAGASCRGRVQADLVASVGARPVRVVGTNGSASAEARLDVTVFETPSSAVPVQADLVAAVLLLVVPVAAITIIVLVRRRRGRGPGPT